MNPTSCIHRSWFPLLYMLNEYPLSELNTILPEISFQPRKENIFRVFRMPLEDIKVVILGQDPYPTPGDSIGLSFVNGTDRIPASLKVIYKELELENYENYDIRKWSEQGVFLLNTSLTVETGNPGSHVFYWMNFIKKVIQYISLKNPCIWLLWGNKSKVFKAYISHCMNIDQYSIENLNEIPIYSTMNYILTSAHPAAEVYGKNAGFYGNNHFRKVNLLLERKNPNSKKQIIY